MPGWVGRREGEARAGVEEAKRGETERGGTEEGGGERDRVKGGGGELFLGCNVPSLAA